MRYNFAATAVAAQPWTWCNVRNTLPPRRGLTRSTAIPIGLDAPLANAMCLAYYRLGLLSRLVDLVPPRRQPGRSLSLVSRPPAHLDLPRPFSLSLPFSPYLLFPARLRREHRIWWNETPTAALITNDRNLNEPDTFPGEFFRCGPQAPGSFTYCENCPARVLRELVASIEGRLLSKRLINDFIVHFRDLLYMYIYRRGG